MFGNNELPYVYVYIYIYIFMFGNKVLPYISHSLAEVIVLIYEAPRFVRGDLDAEPEAEEEADLS